MSLDALTSEPTSSAPDVDLTSWMDAARIGGFPQPTRADRWQPLRAGVVSLWEFDSAEYWYAGGWVQLTGRNETGKSSLMALTTLIPWLADTSSSNIDTLGRSGKRFRYYVEPTGNDGDRRQATSSTNRGWLWVEYGRLVDGKPKYLTSLLFAETRVAAPTVTMVWCTARDARVRDTIDLAPGQVVAHPRDLMDSGVLTHPTAGAYKAWLAEHLLGSTVDRLETAGRMLRATRTPKLGAELNVAFIERNLRTALPELDRSEVDALAAGWDQLEQIKADLDAVEQAVGTVDRFRTSAWLPWARAEVRRRADTASRARTQFDNVTREEREATESLEQLTAHDLNLTEEREAARATEAATATAREELQASQRYRDASSRIEALKHQQEQVGRLQTNLSALSADIHTRRDAEQSAAEEVVTVEEAASKARSEAETARDALATAMAQADVPLASGPLDLPLERQRLSERRRQIDRARALLADATDAEKRAWQAEESAASARDRASDDRDSAEAAWQAASAQREQLVSVLATWASRAVPIPAAATIDAWVAAVPDTVEDGTVPGRPLRDLIRDQWFEHASTGWKTERDNAQRRSDEAAASASNLADRIAQIATAPTPVFAPPEGWARRPRPDSSPTGSPLWALVDPRPDTHPEHLAHLEAALAAQGLLDAWVTPDGVFRPERDGADVVVVPDTAASVDGPSLATVLVASGFATELTGTVESLLGQIRLLAADDPLPDTGLAIGQDGRWRTGALAGRAAPQHARAEWIGESARADQRRRAIAELELKREAALAEQRASAAEADHASQGLSTLMTAFGFAPNDHALRESLLLAAERERVSDASAAGADRSAALAAEQRERADRAIAALHEYCSERSLPRDTPGLDATDRDASDALAKVGVAQGALALLAHQELAVGAAQGRLAARTAERTDAEAKHRATARELETAQTTAHTLEATMGADDAEIVAEVERLRGEEVRARAERDRLDSALRELSFQLGEARNVLASAQAERARATEERDGAFADFRVGVDGGLAEEIELDLRDPHASAVEKVREQVADARRLIIPARWPDAPRDQEQVVQRLYERLIEAVHDVRAELETRGRSAQLAIDDRGLPRIEVQVDASGVGHSPRQAAARLSQIRAELGATYTARVQQTLDELLGSTFLEHLRGRVGTTDALIRSINAKLAEHPVVATKTSLRIVLVPDGEQNRLMLEAMRTSALVNPDAAAHVRNHLRTRVEAAKHEAASAGEADWRDRLVEELDYRRWFSVHLERKVGASGSWRPLTSQGFAEMSGGARAVMLMLPLVATLAALYADMDGSPRPLWLDEAFDGLDSANRATVMALFREFDLDVLLAGPNRLVNVRTVPTAAIYQVVRAPAPAPGADLILELWAGGELRQVDLPTTMPIGRPADPSEESLL